MGTDIFLHGIHYITLLPLLRVIHKREPESLTNVQAASERDWFWETDVVFPFKPQPPTTIYIHVCVCVCTLLSALTVLNLDNFQRLLSKSVASEGVITRLTSCVYHPKYACDL